VGKFSGTGPQSGGPRRYVARLLAISGLTVADYDDGDDGDGDGDGDGGDGSDVHESGSTRCGAVKALPPPLPPFGALAPAKFRQPWGPCRGERRRSRHLYLVWVKQNVQTPNCETKCIKRTGWLRTRHGFCTRASGGGSR
jgi:hypothetical protein